MQILYRFLVLAIALCSGNLVAADGISKAMVVRTLRPPNYESKPEVFTHEITPASDFFVRYHLSGIPDTKAKDWSLKLEGDLFEKPSSFTLAELKFDFPQTEVLALTYCAGNRRGLFEPHVPGVQWKEGAMGNARWKGVRLRDLLKAAGLKKDAIEIVFEGGDQPAFPKTPPYTKSLPIDKALDENTILAFEMNGKPLPKLHGFPARLVVPGWAATYWVKHIKTIQATAKPFDGFWMKTAYRIPKGKFPNGGRFPSQESETTVPITELVVNSKITNLKDEAHFRYKKPIHLQGFAWDGGHGIEKVEISADNGKSWENANLGKDLGKFSWRSFRYSFTPETRGEKLVLAKATNTEGQTQVAELIPNPAGYHNNVVQKIKVVVE